MTAPTVSVTPVGVRQSARLAAPNTGRARAVVPANSPDATDPVAVTATGMPATTVRLAEPVALLWFPLAQVMTGVRVMLKPLVQLPEPEPVTVNVALPSTVGSPIGATDRQPSRLPEPDTVNAWVVVVSPGLRLML